MMAEKAPPPAGTGESVADNSQQPEFTIVEAPALPSCGLCGDLESLYGVGVGFLCMDCIAFAVSLAASDLWPADVTYTAAFERFLIYG